MEKKGNKEKVKKLNININNNSNMELQDYYNTNIKKKHIIIFIIITVIYTLSFISSMYSYKTGSMTVSGGVAPTSLKQQFQDNLLLNGVVILAGITPYFYISVLGGVESVVVINDMILRYAYGESTLITLYIGGLLQMIGVALCVAVGIHFCRLSTKKNKYYHQAGFSFDDVKQQYYNLKENKEKLEELQKKREKKAKEVEECNIKIPYLKFIIFGLIAFAIQLLGVVITKI